MLKSVILPFFLSWFLLFLIPLFLFSCLPMSSWTFYRILFWFISSVSSISRYNFLSGCSISPAFFLNAVVLSVRQCYIFCVHHWLWSRQLMLGRNSWLTILSFQHWKLCHFLQAPMLSDVKILVGWVDAPLKAMSHFSLAGFKIILSLVVYKYKMIYLGTDFCLFILLGVWSASWIYWFVFFNKFGRFPGIISSNNFSLTVLLIFFWTSDDRNVGSFVIVLQDPKLLFIFEKEFYLLCLSCSHWKNSTGLLSSLLILVTAISTLEPIQRVFYFGFCIF